MENVKNQIRGWKDKYQKETVIILIIGFLTHIYGMTNMLGGDDRILNYYNGPGTVQKALQRASTGRWLAALVELLMGWFKSPVVTGIFTITLMAMAAIIFCEIFDIRNRYLQIAVGSMFEAFPAVCVFITLAPDTFAYGVSFFLCIAAMYVLVKYHDRNRFVFSVLIMWMSLSMFMPNISCLLIMMIFYLFYEILILKSSKSDIAEFIKKCVGMIAVSGFFYYIGCVLIMKIMNVRPDDYQGASDAMSGVFLKTFYLNIPYSLFKTWKHSYEWMFMIPQFKFTLILSYITISISWIYLWIKRDIYRSKKRTLLLLIAAMLIPFALSPMSLISYAFRYRAQHCMGYAVFLLGVVIFGKYLKDELKCRTFVKTLIAVTLTLEIYAFFLFDQVEYYNMSYVWERDKTMCTRILCSLDQTDGFEYSDPVYFLDTVDLNYDESNSVLHYDWNLFQTISNSTTNITGGDTSYKSHIQSFEGVSLSTPTQDIIDRINNSELVDISKSLKNGDFKIVKFEETNTYVIIVHHTASPSWEFS